MNNSILHLLPFVSWWQIAAKQQGSECIFKDEDMALAAICGWLGEAGKNNPFNPAIKPA